MARGGPRPGAGRKTGSINKNSQKAVIAAAAEGKLPHEILLDIARGGTIREPVIVDGEQVMEDIVVKDTGEVIGQRIQMRERAPNIEERIKCAIGAAPFYAPKLAAKAVLPESANPIEELMKLAAASGTNRAKVGA